MIGVIIYVDVLLTVNFAVTYFLLLAAAILSGYTYSRKRILAASAVGAVFCLYIFAPFDKAIIDCTVKILSLTVCSAVAYGIKGARRFILQTICFAMLNFLLCGVLLLISADNSAVYCNNMFFYLDINPITLVGCSLAIYLVISVFCMAKEKITPQKIRSIDIAFEDFSIEGVPAFYDSGLKIRDIVTNREIIILSFEKVGDKLPEKMHNDVLNYLNQNFQKVQQAFFPVFFRTIAGEDMVPAVKVKYVKYGDKKIQNVAAAFVKSGLSENVSAIFGTDIYRQIL